MTLTPQYLKKYLNCGTSLSLLAVGPTLFRYAFNIIFNILNKSTLNAFPCPWFISTLQLGKPSARRISRPLSPGYDTSSSIKFTAFGIIKFTTFFF